jgi:hypothetical protein
MLQRNRSPGEALDQGALDGAQPIRATKITFDIGDKPVERPRRIRSAIKLGAGEQLRPGSFLV